MIRTRCWWSGNRRSAPMARRRGRALPAVAGGENFAEGDWYTRVEREPMSEMAWEEFGTRVLLPALFLALFENTVLCPRKVPFVASAHAACRSRHAVDPDPPRRHVNSCRRKARRR
jgi:hypothetical protein